jgi:DNA-binding transcriptional regulator YiaG
MSKNDFLSGMAGAVGAINSGDLKKLLEETSKIVDNNDGAPLATLMRQALAAGLALGRADAANQKPPQTALDFLEFMARPPVAPSAFRTLRKKLGISQTDIANQCEIGISTVSAWERGEEPMPPEALKALMVLITNKMQQPNVQQPNVSGDDLRTLRKKLGMRQVDLAESLGVSVQAIALWEGHAAKPLAAATFRRIRPQLEELRAQAAAVA